MAEAVDASDLKSDRAHPRCRFKSGSRHFNSRKGVFYSAPDAEPHKTKFCFRFKRNFGRGWSFLFGSRKAASKQKMKCRLTPKFQDSPAQGILTPGREFLFRYFYNIQCYRRRADSVCQIQKNLVRAD